MIKEFDTLKKDPMPNIKDETKVTSAAKSDDDDDDFFKAAAPSSAPANNFNAAAFAEAKKKVDSAPQRNTPKPGSAEAILPLDDSDGF